MTSNFTILKDFTFSKHQLEIFEHIEEIEYAILSEDKNEFDTLFIKGRLILETLLTEYSDRNIDVENNNLNSLIKNFIDMNTVPTKVINAFYIIKSEANGVSHIVKESNKPFSIKNDKHSCIEFLKQLFIVLKYFIIQYSNKWDDHFEKDYCFDSAIYDKDKNSEILTISTEDISPNLDSLLSKTKGIFELICSSYSFLVPTYQRSYTWKTENVEIFLQDISDRKEDKKIHYLGSLAIAVDAKNKVLRIIDGQQRITTSLLLIKAMLNRFEKSKVLVTPKELKDLKETLPKKYINKSSNFGDIAYIGKILIGLKPSIDKSFENSNAYKNFLLISEYVNAQEDFEEFYVTFVYNFVISELKFQNELEQEIQIFENLNSKGMELSQWDLIKNYIFKCVETSFLIESEAEIEEVIKNMFEIPTNTYFNNIDKSYKELSSFFSLYCRVKYKEEKGKVLNDKGKIHKIFQSVWPSKKNRNSNDKINSIEMLEKELLEIAKYLSIYLEIKSGHYKHTSSPLFEFKLPIENTSQKDAHYPLIMKAFYISSKFVDFKINKVESKNAKNLLKLNETIEKYLIRLIVSNNKGQSLSQFFDKNISNELDEMYKLFVESIKIPGLGNSLPPIEELRKSIEEKNDWQGTYAIAILKRLEANVENVDNKRFSIILNSSLEHIFPRKYKDTFWRGRYILMSDKDFKDKHSSHINMLGNYIIISQNINSKALNYDFLQKKKEYAKDSSSKLINGNFSWGKLMNLLDKDTFTFEDIEKRSKELANLIVPLYKMEFE